MTDPDFNLLAALDALLAERSVAGAARRLRLSASAMSRTLARLRSVTGDPLLVRAGSVLVPTPHAQHLAARLPDLLRDARAVLQPMPQAFDVASLEAVFTIRANEGFVAAISPALVTRILDHAPNCRVRFAPKPDKGSDPLRAGDIALDIGVLGEAAPELRTRLLFRDRFVGAARAGHPLLKGEAITPDRYVAHRHVAASRRGAFVGPVDVALQEAGHSARDVAVVVPGFPDALRLAATSDLLALVPRTALAAASEAGLVAFDLPVETPEIAILAMWHPRMDADPGHRWLRDCVRSVCAEVFGSGAMGAHAEDDAEQ